MSKKDKDKIIDLGTKYIELTFKKLFGEKPLEEVSQQMEQERQTAWAKFREVQMALAKEEMMIALSKWNGYRLDEFTRFEEKVSKEIWPFPDSSDQLSEAQRNYIERLMAAHAISLAITILEEDGRNWKEILPSVHTKRKYGK